MRKKMQGHETCNHMAQAAREAQRHRDTEAGQSAKRSSCLNMHLVTGIREWNARKRFLLMGPPESGFCELEPKMAGVAPQGGERVGRGGSRRDRGEAGRRN